MTAVKGHDKCTRAPRRMPGVVLLDTWHVADVNCTWHAARHVQLSLNGRPRCLVSDALIYVQLFSCDGTVDFPNRCGNRDVA